MLHQLVFQSLLGEIDYGAQGDFSTAGCAVLHEGYALTPDVRPALFAQLQPAHTGHGLEVGAKPVLRQSEV